MPAFKQIVRELGLPEEKVNAMVETMLGRADSTLYKEMALNLKDYVTAGKRAEEAAVMSGEKAVVRVPYGVDVVEMRVLEADFPEFKVEFSRRDKLMGGIGIARWYLETQALFQMLKGHRGDVVYISDSYEHVVLRNRHYVHVCTSKRTVDAQVLAGASNRAVAAFAARLVKPEGRKTKGPGVPVKPTLAVESWRSGNMVCSVRERCKFQAPVLLMDYTQYCLNWEQHAMVIDAHGAKRVFSIVPIDDVILSMVDGFSEALQAWILFDHSVDTPVTFTIHYENDYTRSRTYDYEAYRHFLTQASVRFKGKTFYREFVDQRPGYLTCVTSVIDEDVAVDVDASTSRLWMSPSFVKLSRFVVYELKEPFLDPTVRRNYIPRYHVVDAEVRDRIITSARLLEVKSFTEAKIIEITRMHMSRQMTESGSKFVEATPLLEQVVRALGHLIYVRVWDERHSTTLVRKRLIDDLGHVRENSKRWISGLLLSYIGRVITDGVKGAFDGISLGDSYETWRERILRVESESQLLPFFEDAYEFVEVASSMAISEYKVFSGSYSHFDESLTGGFLARVGSTVEAVARSKYSAEFLNFRVGKLIEKSAAADKELLLEERFVEMEEVEQDKPREVPEAAQALYVKLISSLDVQAMDDIDDPIDVLPVCEIPEEFDHEFPRVETETYDSPVNILQAASDAFGMAPNGEHRILDEMLLHGADLSIPVTANRLDLTTSSFEAHKPLIAYPPNVITNAPPKALNTTDQMLISMNSRNMNTPQIYEPMDPELVWNDLVFPALVEYLGPVGMDKVRVFKTNPVYRDFQEIGDWLATRDPAVYRQLIDMDIDPVDMDLTQYQAMLKLERKPQLTKAQGSTLKPTQTVNYHTKEKVATWSPVFRRAAKRFTSLVSHRAFISMLKSPRDLVIELNRRLKGRHLVDLHVTAVDHSAYDKSQARVAKFCEMMFYVHFLGVSEDLVGEWMAGQYIGEMSSVITGIRLFIEMQRRTGDATTALGNTVLNFLSFVSVLRGWHDDVLFDGFMGDDMVRFSSSKIPSLSLESRMNSIFNFSVKEIRISVGYYLSGAITEYQGRWVWVPDLPKALIKIGNPLPPEPDAISDRWISFCDRMSVLRDREVVDAVIPLMAIWYDLPTDVIDQIAIGLWSCAKDYDCFRRLWSSELKTFYI